MLVGPLAIGRNQHLFVGIGGNVGQWFANNLHYGRGGLCAKSSLLH
jgi:hypothetical protein